MPLREWSINTICVYRRTLLRWATEIHVCYISNFALNYFIKTKYLVQEMSNIICKLDRLQNKNGDREKNDRKENQIADVFKSTNIGKDHAWISQSRS